MKRIITREENKKAVVIGGSNEIGAAIVQELQSTGCPPIFILEFTKKLQQTEKKLLSNTLFLYVMQISGYVFPLLSFPYLTRVLGADKYGVVVFSNAVMSYFQMLIEFGFILSATNNCSIHRDDKTKLAHITFGVIQAKMVLVLLGAVILFFCCLLVPIFQDKKTFFALSYIGIMLSALLPDYLFRGIEQMSTITYRVLFSKLVYTGLVFLLVHNDNDYLKVPVAVIGGNLIAVLLMWYEIIRKLHIQFIHVSLKETVHYLQDSSVFFLSNVAVNMYQSLNTVVLGFQFSSASIAQYGAANTLISSGRGLFSPISNSIYPYMIVKKNYRLVKKIILILEPLICVACIGLFIFAESFVVLLCGNQYADSVPVFRAMLPLIAISLPTYLLGYPVMGALGKIKIANSSVIIASVFHLAGLFSLYFLGHLNFIALALLTFCTECIVFTIRTCCVLRELRKRF
ncbi:transporter [Spirochaetia bacterium]|nr:transporter [Spirochaetia bacterium]